MSVQTLRVFKSNEARAEFMAIYDARIREWPVACEELDLPTRFGSTHVIASGAPEHPPLVLLASMMGTATVWRVNAATLSRHFRLFAVDLVGEPNKSEPTQRIRSRRGYAEWLTDVLDALRVDRTSVVGNSYGGFLALSQASLTPERVDRVVLISPAATIAPIWSFYGHAILAGLSTIPGLSRVSPGFFEWLANGVPLNPLDANWGELMRIGSTGGRPVNIVPPRVFGKAELRQIRVPTLLLIGEREVIYEPHATLARAMARMPGLKGEIISGANHLAAMTNPVLVDDRIVRFLKVE